MKLVSTCFQFEKIVAPHLQQRTDFEHYPPVNQSWSSSELLEIAKEAEILVAGDDELDENFLSQASKLKLLVRWGAGIDNVDLEYAASIGLKVVNTPGLFGSDVADLAVTLAMGIVRQLPMAHFEVLRGGWHKETTFSASQLSFGLLGYGAVGKEIAGKLAPFAQTIYVFDPFAEWDGGNGLTFVTSFEELLEKSNLLVLASPLTPDTMGLVGKEEVLRLQKPRFVVNISRGEIVRQNEVLELLKTHELSGLGLDVYEEEPPALEELADSHLNVLFSCHNASNTFASIKKANMQVEKLILEAVQGWGSR